MNPPHLEVTLAVRLRACSRALLREGTRPPAGELTMPVDAPCDGCGQDDGHEVRGGIEVIFTGLIDYPQQAVALGLGVA